VRATVAGLASAARRKGTYVKTVSAIGTVVLAFAGLPALASAQSRSEPAVCAQARALRAQGQTLEARKATRACMTERQAIARAEAAAQRDRRRSQQQPAGVHRPVVAQPPVAVLDTAWTTQLPTVNDVRGKVGNDTARRDASLEVLKEYISSRLDRPLEFDPSKAPPLAAQRWEQYRAAQTVIRNKVGIVNGLTAEAGRLYGDQEFRVAAVASLVSAEAASFYRTSPYHQRLVGLERRVAATRQKQAEAGAQKEQSIQTKQRIDASKSRGVDYKVFGIELGEALSNFPACEDDQDRELLSGLMGVGRGRPKTCVGGIMMGGAAMIGGAAQAMGLATPETDLPRQGMTLADTQCPQWLRLGGSCGVMAALHQGFVVGVDLVPSSSPDMQKIIVQELTRKYGKAPTLTGEVFRCTNNLTGIATQQAQTQAWALPGLYVTYRPLVTDCKRGNIKVELAFLRRLMTKAQESYESSQPKM
jgi:hypothetical protein